MNTITNNLFTTTSKEATREFTTACNETVALDFQQLKTFTVADLWNLQRKSRTLLQRRRSA